MTSRTGFKASLEDLQHHRDAGGLAFAQPRSQLAVSGASRPATDALPRTRASKAQRVARPKARTRDRPDSSARSCPKCTTALPIGLAGRGARPGAAHRSQQSRIEILSPRLIPLGCDLSRGWARGFVLGARARAGASSGSRRGPPKLAAAWVACAFGAALAALARDPCRRAGPKSLRLIRRILDDAGASGGRRTRAGFMTRP